MKFTTVCLALSALATTSGFAVLPSASKAASTTHFANLGGDGESTGVTSKTADWEINKISPNQRIQGNTRHTWSMTDSAKEIVQVCIQSSGRPLNNDIQLWIGPDWTPVTIKCHSEDGKKYHLQTLVGTRNQGANLEIRNTGLIQGFSSAVAATSKNFCIVCTCL